MKKTFKNKVLSVVLTLMTAMSVVAIAPETADAASFSVSIDGQATKLGELMYEKDGYHFVEVNAFSEAFGFPMKDISYMEKYYEEEILRNVALFSVAGSDRGPYTGTYYLQPQGTEELGYWTSDPAEWELTLSFIPKHEDWSGWMDDYIWLESTKNGETLSMGMASGYIFIDTGMLSEAVADGELNNINDERISRDQEKWGDYTSIENVSGKKYVALEIACWLLDYSFNMNDSTIQISSANSALGIKPAVKAGTPASALTATNTEVGILIRWTGEADATGYRIYRSETQGERGELIYEGGPTPTEYVDVNVKSNTAYYYTVCKLTGGQETDMALENNGSAITTGAILGEEKEGKKGFLLMTVDSPVMSVNGAPKEIDPGRGTAPKIVDGRTLMPISAAMEAMGGSVGWNDAERKVSLSNAENNLEMWIGQRMFTANGVSKELDIPPQVINGRTMLPIKFVAENIGCEIAWVGTTKEIIVVYWEN